MRRPGAGTLLAAVVALVALLGQPAAVRGAEYTMVTTAEYDVQPDEGLVAVSVEVEFTNTTPDPPGQFSVFSEVRLAVHDQASALTARDSEGALTVDAGSEGGVMVATIALREPVRFRDSVSFTVGYELADSDDAQLRVRRSVVIFPAWGFGTASEVTVTLPTGYEVIIDGDPLTQASDEPGRTLLTSGAIRDPTRWLAQVTAVRPASYTTFSASVALRGGTVDLQVRAFEDDQAWGERVLDILERSLPVLEEQIGIPYGRVGPLVVTEAVAVDSSGFAEGDPPGDDGEGGIRVAFDQPPFTLLHQVAHIWLGPAAVGERWIGEGMASYLAATVAPELDVALPFDPAVATSEASAAAFPLADWPTASSADTQAYGYAASWALLDEVADAAGAEALPMVLRRVLAGVDPLTPAVDGDPSPTGLPPQPLTSRSLLDHLEAVTGLDLAPRFAALALSADDAALLPARAEAHTAHGDLLQAAGDWGAPDPVRAALTAWEFDVAAERIAAAGDWLEERDRLLTSMEAAGLAAPDRLQTSYREHGGAAEGWAELEAERAVTDAYAATLTLSNEPRSLLERVGLLGARDADAQLVVAHGRFAAGDLRAATEAITDAQQILDGAEMAGIVRLLSALAAAGLLLAAAALLVRGRRSQARAT